MKKAVLILASAMMFTTCASAQSTENILRNEVLQNISEDAVKEAVSLGIIEEGELTKELSREEFCGLVYNMINKVKELPQAKLAENPFSDVTDYKINALYVSKIISGRDDHIFAPNDKITREEAAAIIYRTAEYAGKELPMVKIDINYADNDKISQWALPCVYGLRVLNVIDDIEKEFNPQSGVTKQRAAEVLVKMYNILK